MTVPAIELIGISKSFGPVQANKDIAIRVERGTIHGIIGENGAGKSTLMSILYGFYKADAGEVFISGQKTEIPDSQAAIAAGIGMVFQHFKLVENFTVLENVVLGAEDGRLLRPSLAKARRELKALADDYGLNVDPDAVIETIGVGQQQRVEILKALYRQADILILDEPTGVLTPAEADQLFRILGRLRDEGKTIILITHKLREIMEITDSVSVMRRGQMIATVKTADTTPTELAELMVGRKVLLRVDKTPARPGDPVLEIEGLSVTDSAGVARLNDVSLTLRKGEILGLAGVAGNGQSELLEVLGGMREGRGTVRLNGKPLALSGPDADGQARRAAGIGHVPEDRQREGLVMPYSAWENSIFGYHRDSRWQNGPLMDNASITANAREQMERFDVRPPDPTLAARNFSGGNQQKIVVAREIDQGPDLLLIGQPTRGVDIGAIEFIHQQIIALRDQGKAILLVSVELDEILSLSDRVAVMFDGKIMGEGPADSATQSGLGGLMAGLAGDDTQAMANWTLSADATRQVGTPSVEKIEAQLAEKHADASKEV
ncbi:ABC transporter ATP-binding protein [Lutimaribacter sp. EGI FJ00015]|uniref:ABC transporter ATP-binding protein n=1 Tax=Lutimaribacter degradans TaxID=2945989 RepID=A0ACC5ZYR8_9RHOB|nr:ABC transporter ATP-binding protein [Lutimaribacter sp. EGI FJ00013]MCM2563494.1 ABC transporter ATP-binding protein [Lutimaribacter sp. EGI FJ00013]MCO0614674.1 ABC transporter ATP-binding protein [Lutimaribacter sp. EGI FJ00015]MCO0637344.1 ABC transporter ATP-binding protein [Lutimaribacter sp. EGI FJ00014]